MPLLSLFSFHEYIHCNTFYKHLKTLFDCVTFETVYSSSLTVVQCAQVYAFLTILSDKKKNVIFELMKLIDIALDCSQVEHRLEPFSLGRECAYNLKGLVLTDTSLT